MKPLKIHIGGLTEPKNISEVAKLYPDFMGFVFYSFTPKYYRYQSLPKIPSSIKKIGVFVNQTFEEIQKIQQSFGLDFIQLHGQETPEFCKLLKENNFRIIKAISIYPEIDFESLKDFTPFCEYFLFDTYTAKPGAQSTDLWILLKKYSFEIPFFLSGGVSLENLQIAMKIGYPQLMALELDSEWEFINGVKDISLLQRGFSIIRNFF